MAQKITDKALNGLSTKNLKIQKFKKLHGGNRNQKIKTNLQIFFNSLHEVVPLKDLIKIGLIETYFFVNIFFFFEKVFF